MVPGVSSSSCGELLEEQPGLEESFDLLCQVRPRQNTATELLCDLKSMASFLWAFR